ncbi:MAG: hypothetical protein EXS33_04630 [Pedosphaera sp.]|nr:hypothetical protein [Pedosphaera sp.]
MTAPRELKHSVSLLVGGTMLAIGLTLLALLGLAAVVIPAALGILAMELKRAREWLPKAHRFLPRLFARNDLKPEANPGNECV